jgi:hypothetical protein
MTRRWSDAPQVSADAIAVVALLVEAGEISASSALVGIALPAQSGPPVVAAAGLRLAAVAIADASAAGAQAAVEEISTLSTNILVGDAGGTPDAARLAAATEVVAQHVSTSLACPEFDTIADAAAFNALWLSRVLDAASRIAARTMVGLDPATLELVTETADLLGRTLAILLDACPAQRGDTRLALDSPFAATAHLIWNDSGSGALACTAGPEHALVCDFFFFFFFFFFL